MHLLRWRELAEQAGIATDLVSYDQRHADAVAHIEALPDDRVARLRALAHSARRFRRIVHERSPDVVHAHWLTGPAWIAALAGSRPLVVTAWGSDALRWTPASRLARLLARLVAARAAALTYDANSVRDALAASGATREQLVRIVIGADDERFTPRPRDGELLDRLGAPRDRPVVLSGRGLDPVYRQDVVVRAFARLSPATNATLLVRAEAGDPRLVALRAQADELGVGERLVTFDDVDDDELPRLLASVDAAVSVPESDGTSVLLLECLLCERPVLVSDLPANREWVPMSTGWLVPVGDPDALASAIDSVLADAPAAQLQARALALTVAERGSRKRQRDEMLALYERLA